MTRAGLSSFVMDTKLWRPKIRGVQRLSWFRKNLISEVEEFAPQLVVIEGYAYAKGNSAHQIGELGGVLRLALLDLGVSYIEVAPSKLKKFVTGKGNAPKDAMMIEAFKRFKVDVPTSDECDAATLALFGAVLGEHLVVDLPKANMEAIRSVTS